MPSRPTTPPDDPLGSLLRARHLVEPPDGVLRRALALRAALPAPQSLGAWLAEILFDSGRQPLPAGLRSTASAERRVLLAVRPPGAAEAVRQFDLRLRREPAGTLELVGQCLPPWPGAVVEAGTGRSRRTSPIDETGEFLLRGIAAKGDAVHLSVSEDGHIRVTLEAPMPDGGSPAER